MAFVDDKAITEFWNQAKAYFAYKAGDKITLTNFSTAGYVTGASAYVYFTYPLCKPATATAATASDFSMTLRKSGGGYSHGSSATVAVAPSAVTVDVRPDCLRLVCQMGDTTAAVNNAPVGIAVSGTITFS